MSIYLFPWSKCVDCNVKVLSLEENQIKYWVDDVICAQCFKVRFRLRNFINGERNPKGLTNEEATYYPSDCRGS